MDNCSHNGDILHNTINTFSVKWAELGRVEQGFVNYINDRNKITFPWSMIDKITPRPHESIEHILKEDEVEGVEPMKVCTCLNPLHTTLAVYGCLLNHERICDEMKEPQMKRLVERVGYDEGLPVVIHPGILEPKEFIDMVLNIRIPDPLLESLQTYFATIKLGDVDFVEAKLKPLLESETIFGVNLY